MDDLISWLTSDVGRIAVFDATNTTRERRLWIMERCKTHNFQVIFVESICKDKNLIQENVLVRSCFFLNVFLSCQISKARHCNLLTLLPHLSPSGWQNQIDRVVFKSVIYWLTANCYEH